MSIDTKDLRLPPRDLQIEPVKPAPPGGRRAAAKADRRARKRDQVQEFVQVPMEWVRRLRGLHAGVDLAFELLSESWWTGSKAVVASRELIGRSGIKSRETRRRVTKQLEERGLILATQHGKEAPQITLKWLK